MDETLDHCLTCRSRDLCKETGLPLEVTADLMALLKVVSPDRHPGPFVEVTEGWGLRLSQPEVVEICGFLERHAILCPLSR